MGLRDIITKLKNNYSGNPKVITLKDVKIKVEKLAAKIGAPDNLLPTYGYSKDGAWPHIEVLGNVLYYVVVERGKELRRSTINFDQLLYWIFVDVTFSMAVKYELAHRVEDKDSRRIIFLQQEKLLGLLNIKWQDKEAQRHHEILKNHPFDDLAGLRASYIAKLRRDGHTEIEIKKLTEKYPS